MINQQKLQQILSLWAATFNGRASILMPGFIEKLDKNKVLFVGMNPSFSDKLSKTILKKAKEENNSDFDGWLPAQYYNFSNMDSFDYEKAYRMELFIAKHAPYFKKFSAVAGSDDWVHADLFFYRMTKQKDFKEMIFDSNETLNDFGKKQLELSWGEIKESQPKIIVVVNALASSIVRQFTNEVFTFHEDVGYHRILINKVETPVFFTSMLTGQRGLDNGSFDRLCWHVRQALKQQTY